MGAVCPRCPDPWSGAWRQCPAAHRDDLAWGPAQDAHWISSLLRRAGALLALREANYSNPRAATWDNPPHHLPWTVTTPSLCVSPTTHSQVSTGRSQPQLTAAQAARWALGVAAPAGFDAKNSSPPLGQVTTGEAKLVLLKSQSLRKGEERGQRKEAIYQSMLKLDNLAYDRPFWWAPYRRRSTSRDYTETTLQYALLTDCCRLPAPAA